jgi:integrase
MASTGKRRISPIDYFPATPRADGRYQKFIRGKFYYFGGPGMSREDAIAAYQRVRHDLYAGTVLQASDDYSTWMLRDFSNKYLDARRAEVLAGTLRKVTYLDLRSSLLQFVRHVGTRRLVSELDAALFTAATAGLKGKLSGCRWNHIVSAVNAWLNYAVAHQWLEKLPAFGPKWCKIPPSQLPRRDRTVSPAEFRKLTEAASEQMRAMLYLALNGGMGPTDLAVLKLAEVEGNVIRCRRHKTKLQRVIPLWPETREALDDWLTRRISKLDTVFVTKFGRAWDGPDVVHEFTDLRKAAGFDMQQRWGMYALRHTFSTVADDHGDGNAKRIILGHALPGMDAVYVAGKRLERLREVVEVVRRVYVNSPAV